jgi:hypothetical protein
MKLLVLFSVLILAPAAFGQTPQDNPPSKQEKAKKHGKGTVADVGSGVGAAAGGVAKGVADLATLHPINAGKDVTVGSVKGAARISKGVGHAVKKIL